MKKYKLTNNRFKQFFEKMKKSVITKLAVFMALVSIAMSCYLLNNNRQEVILGLSYNTLKNYHYNEIDFNDTYSKHIFGLYMENLDDLHRFFLNSDFKKLSKFSDKIDDEIRQSDLTFFKTSYSLLIQRENEAKAFYPDILSKPFDFNVKEEIVIGKDDEIYRTSAKELYAYWQKLLKLEVLQIVESDMRQQEEKQKKSDTVKVKTFEQLEADARQKVLKSYNDYFDRLSKLTEDDYFNIFINSIVSAADPHTEYFPPKGKEDFDIYMSGELEGIGATLSQSYGEVKIVDIVPGGAAWKEGELENGDVILKVAQEGQDPVSIASMRLDDAVRLIRGKKGTVVILTIRKIDGSIKDIKITRDKVILEEAYIKTVILKDSNGDKVAYLDLPSFYIDFQHYDGRSCSEDFKKELLKLRSENVKSIIIDLRNNGGGSLSEVVKIAGFFIEKGPIVQVRDRYNKSKELDDEDASVLFNGNVLVLTNYGSASASEIFAAALQDYNRAVIFGNKQSFGKGTVQEMLDLDKTIAGNKDIKPLGALKLTIQKFYRINGGSTQVKGVKSDIVYPSVYDLINVSETSLDYALPYDSIAPLKYQIWHPTYNIDSLAARSYNRLKNDSVVILSQQYAEMIAKEEKLKVIPLNYNEYKAYDDSKLTVSRKYNAYMSRLIDGVTFQYLSDDQKLMQNDTLMKNRYDGWIKRLSKDAQLKESFNIVLDMDNQK